MDNYVPQDAPVFEVGPLAHGGYLEVILRINDRHVGEVWVDTELPFLNWRIKRAKKMLLRLDETCQRSSGPMLVKSKQPWSPGFIAMCSALFAAAVGIWALFIFRHFGGRL